MVSNTKTWILEIMEEYTIVKPIYALAIVVVVSYIVVQLWSYLRRGRYYPPGPIGLPIVGYVPFLNGPAIHQDLYQLGKKYGHIFSLKLGQMNTVVINDFEAMKESGRKEEYSYRPDNFFEWTEAQNIESLNGAPWKEQRKIIMSSIRTTIGANSKFEERVQELISSALQAFKESPKDSDVNVREILGPVFNNIILLYVCGKDYNAQHETNQLLTPYRVKILEYFEKVRVPFYFPLIYKLWTKLSPTFRSIREEMSVFDNRMREEIEEHQKSLDQDGAKSYIDLFLDEAKKNERLQIPVLLANCQVNLMAGGEFIRSTIEWALLCMARHRIFQEAVHRQIINVIGSDRLPEWKDREKLILVQALILEVYRFKTLIAISDPHKTSKDAELRGFKIPKNTMILLNLWGVHNDEDFWGDPESFRPDRFLSKDFESIVNSERVIPFGIGKRNCPGEKLAELELFLFLTALLQKFRFLPPEKGVCMDEISFVSQMVVSPIIRVEIR